MRAVVKGDEMGEKGARRRWGGSRRDASNLGKLFLVVRIFVVVLVVVSTTNTIKYIT